MIPILYEKTETAFINNGLCRLRDAISAIVTEERNGIYEMNFEYPVDGANFDLIQIGRIVGVTHDDTGNIQPFDIVSYSKPINGVVSFHCTHISYRQSYITMTGGSINDLNTALASCKHGTNLGNDGNPFTYWTNMVKSGYCAAIGIVPQTVRSVLGGVEGSILDTYGGEYEWDKFTVKLWSARGQLRDFTIRYGVNMLDYNEECDTQGTFSSCIPYWTSGEVTTVAPETQSGNQTITGRGECVPLDLSDKFEENPTQAQLQSAAVSYMASNKTYLPVQNIHVEFVRLQDMNEYAGFQNLLQCGLCDTINVVFPDYNSSGAFKIVQTVWNVLNDKYDSMELGDLSVSLSEALGIDALGSDMNITSTPEDYVTEIGTSSGWRYRKWKNGWVEAWCYYSVGSVAITTSSPGYGGYRSAEKSITIPSGIFPGTPGCQVQKAQAQGGWIAHATGRSATQIVVMYGSGTSQTITNQYVYVYAYWYN